MFAYLEEAVQTSAVDVDVGGLGDDQGHSRRSRSEGRIVISRVGGEWSWGSRVRLEVGLHKELQVNKGKKKSQRQTVLTDSV